MCELFAMSADRPTVIEYELDRFAAEGGEVHQNRDGWGIIFVEERDAHVFREAKPASDSALAHMVVNREIPCRTMMAHVRRASHGHLDLANTHPFTRVVRGKTCHFAHNGTLHGIDEFAPDLRRECVGDTDSELAFMILLRKLDALVPGSDSTRDRFQVFLEFCRDMAKLGSANILFYDGGTLFVHAHRRVYETPTGLTPPKPPGLHIRRFGAEDEHWHGPGARIHNLPGPVILLASVPLDPSGWRALPEGHVLALRDGQILFESKST